MEKITDSNDILILRLNLFYSYKFFACNDFLYEIIYQNHIFLKYIFNMKKHTNIY